MATPNSASEAVRDAYAALTGLDVLFLDWHAFNDFFDETERTNWDAVKTANGGQFLRLAAASAGATRLFIDSGDTSVFNTAVSSGQINTWEWITVRTDHDPTLFNQPDGSGDPDLWSYAHHARWIVGIGTDYIDINEPIPLPITKDRFGSGQGNDHYLDLAANDWAHPTAFAAYAFHEWVRQSWQKMYMHDVGLLKASVNAADDAGASVSAGSLTTGTKSLATGRPKPGRDLRTGALWVPTLPDGAVFTSPSVGSLTAGRLHVARAHVSTHAMTSVGGLRFRVRDANGADRTLGSEGAITNRRGAGVEIISVPFLPGSGAHTLRIENNSGASVTLDVARVRFVEVGPNALEPALPDRTSLPSGRRSLMLGASTARIAAPMYAGSSSDGKLFPGGRQWDDDDARPSTWTGITHIHNGLGGRTMIEQYKDLVGDGWDFEGDAELQDLLWFGMAEGLNTVNQRRKDRTEPQYPYDDVEPREFTDEYWYSTNYRAQIVIEDDKITGDPEGVRRALVVTNNLVGLQTDDGSARGEYDLDWIDDLEDDLAQGLNAGAFTVAGRGLFTFGTSQFGNADGDGAVLTPGVGGLTLAAFAPGVIEGASVTLSPGVGALSLSGLAPTVGVGSAVSLSPSVGALALSGLAPTVRRAVTLSPGVGVLTTTGLAPSVRTGAGTTLTPDVGVLGLNGFVPVLAAPARASPTPGALALVGFAPAVGSGDAVTLQPLAGALSLSGFAPGVTEAVTVSPTPAALSLSGLSPALTAGEGSTAQPTAGTLVLSGLAPTVSGAAAGAIQPSTGSLTLTGLAPSIDADAAATLAPTPGALVLSGFAPALTEGAATTLQPSPGALTLSGFAPGVQTAASATLQPTPGALTLSGLAPGASGGAILTPSGGALTLAGLVPSVQVGQLEAPSDRLFLVEAETRVFAVAVETRIFPVLEGDDMVYAAKDPDADLAFGFDWSDWLDDDVSIASVEWTPTSPLVVGTTGNTGSVTTARVSGGEAGDVLDLECVVTLSTGEVDTRTIRFEIQNR